jgi:hypothetical protein
MEYKVFYSVLYTVSGDPAKNLYLSMMALQFQSLLAQGVIGPSCSSTYIIAADKHTVDVARDMKVFAHPFVSWVIIPKPQDTFDGMIARYRIHEHATSAQKTLLENATSIVYLDCDLYCIKPFDLTPAYDSLMIFADGNSVEGIHRRIKLDDPAHHAGFSSGIFAFHWGPRTKEFLRRVAVMMEQNRNAPRYITLDQPYFNAVIYDLGSIEMFEAIDHNMVSNNEKSDLDVASLIHFCDDTANDGFHWIKMLDYHLRATVQGIES